MSTEKNIFAKNLDDLIKEHNYTHQDVAKGVDVTRQAVGKWVKGESVPDVLTAGKLAKFLGVSVDYLAGNSEIKSTDVQVQSVCKFTGLDESAIENIINRTSCPEPIYDKITKTNISRTIFTPQYYESNRTVLNRIFSCSWFWDIVLNYVIMSELQEKSFEYKKNYDAVCQALQEGKSVDKIYNIAQKSMQHCNDIDVARYSVTRLIEKISDMFDNRNNTEDINIKADKNNDLPFDL
ncbi:MAG: helix-turn-helix transcriptional regulator [Oscillospiraceae bacterium]